MAEYNYYLVRHGYRTGLYGDLDQALEADPSHLYKRLVKFTSLSAAIEYAVMHCFSKSYGIEDTSTEFHRHLAVAQKMKDSKHIPHPDQELYVVTTGLKRGLYDDYYEALASEPHEDVVGIVGFYDRLEAIDFAKRINAKKHIRVCKGDDYDRAEELRMEAKLNG